MLDIIDYDQTCLRSGERSLLFAFSPPKAQIRRPLKTSFFQDHTGYGIVMYFPILLAYLSSSLFSGYPHFHPTFLVDPKFNPSISLSDWKKAAEEAKFMKILVCKEISHIKDVYSTEFCCVTVTFELLQSSTSNNNTQKYLSRTPTRPDLFSLSVSFVLFLHSSILDEELALMASWRKWWISLP
jgi:hypothetical protein